MISSASRPPLLIVGRLVLGSTVILAILSSCIFFDEVDRCLDRGGRWNETIDACKLHQRSADEATASEAPSEL